MPTKHPRIPVVKDAELTEALDEIAHLVEPGTKTTRLVHDLAVRGARQLADQRRDHDEAIERLIEWSTTPGSMDREALRRARASSGGPWPEW